MFYIDDYGKDQLVTAKPVNKKSSAKVAQNDLDAFWFMMGAMVGEQYDAVKSVLSKYGYQVNSRSEAVDALSQIQNTPKWPSFFKEIFPVIEHTVRLKGKKNEESWAMDPYTAIIDAIGKIGAGTTNMVASSAQKKEAQANAKGQLLNGLALVAVENQKRRALEQQSASNETRNMIIIIVALVIIIGIIITVVILRQRRNKLKN